MSADCLDLPERRPEPISLRHLGGDLDLSVSDRLLALGVETRGANRGNGVAQAVVAADDAVEGCGGRAGPVGGEVDGEAVGDLLVGDGG